VAIKVTGNPPKLQVEVVVEAELPLACAAAGSWKGVQLP